MTDKVQKIREEVEKLKSNLKYGACSSQIAMETFCKEEAYNEVLAILGTMQREPVSEDLEEACEQLAENARKHKAETSSPFFSPTDYKQGVIDGAAWQKQKDSIVSEYLEDAASSFARKDSEGISNPADFYYTVADKARIFKAGANWQKEQDKQWLADNHKQIFHNGFEEGFEAGRDDMEEQTMKTAVECKVKSDSDGLFTTETWDDINSLLHKINAKEGDKVKLIFVKDD